MRVVDFTLLNCYIVKLLRYHLEEPGLFFKIVLGVFDEAVDGFWKLLKLLED